MIELEIEALQKEKAKTIELPEHLIGNKEMEFNIIKNEWIMEHHKDFYDRVILLWRKVGSTTQHLGHSEKMDSFKTALGSLIYI